MCNEIEHDFSCLTDDELMDLVRQRASHHLDKAERAHGKNTPRAARVAFEDLQDEFEGHVDIRTIEDEGLSWNYIKSSRSSRMI